MTLKSKIANEIAENLASDCFYCFGTGRLKLKEAMAQFNGTTVSRDSKKTVKCRACGGTGRTKRDN